MELTPVFLPGDFHGHRSLAGCSPWDHRDLDTTEQIALSLSQFQNYVSWNSMNKRVLSSKKFGKY